MSSLNKVMLIGNLTRDPELKTIPSGAKLVEMGLAVNRTSKSESGETRTDTTFLDITFWGKTAENVAKFLKKGRSVYVEGRLQMDSWQDKATGQTRTKLKVAGDTIQFLSAPQDSNPATGGTSQSYQQAA